MKYKLLIFDMDGTFVDSRPFHAKIFWDFFERYFRAVRYEKCYQLVGKTVCQLFDSCGIPKDQQDRYFDLLEDYYSNEGAKYVSLTKVPNDFKEVLEWTCLGMNRIKTAVVTNSLNCIARKILDYHKLYELFDDVIGADRNSTDKIERCQTLLKKYGFCIDEVLLIGDTEDDIILANSMNFNSCFARTEIAWYKDCDYIRNELKPTIEIKSFSELKYILEKF